MKLFIFRNNTVEQFFGNKEYDYSGYDDISYLPTDSDGYIWFYQVPVTFDIAQKCEILNSYKEKLQYVVNRLPKGKPFILFTMVDLFPISYSLDDFAVVRSINSYNELCWDLADTNSNIKIIELADFTNNFVEKDLIHWRFYFNSQTYLSPMIADEFKTWFSKQLDKIALKRKKCLVLDLDNTLWGGVLGEDGVEGIEIGGEYPGKAFLYWQNALKSLKDQGVILTVCSKNNEADVIEVWEKNPFLVLRKDDFAAIRINWNNKAENIADLAKELNIGLDSMVFIDDNPTERELINQSFPMVETPDFPLKPYQLPAFFKELINRYFSVYSITDEDRKKTEQYLANSQRVQEQTKYADIESFIKSLEIKIDIIPADDFNLPRIAQMTQKTNQFNLTTHRYTDTELNQRINDGWKIYCISVSDRFGDSGITGCIMLDGNRIDTLLLSCRILGKNIECAFVKTILALLKSEGKSIIEADYIPSKRNAQVADFYDKNGFAVIEESDGAKHYVIDLNNASLAVPEYYTIKFA